MTVYVDQMMATVPSRKWPFKHSCHLYADDLVELHQFAERLSLRPEWFQPKEETGLDHYDLVTSRRKRAVKLGAQIHGFHEAADFMAQNRLRIARKTP